MLFITLIKIIKIINRNTVISKHWTRMKLEKLEAATGCVL